MVRRFTHYAGAVAFVLAIGCGGPSSGASIGAMLVRDNVTGAVHVRDTPEGHAASEAGLLPGDEVKMIDGVHVEELDKGRVRTLLRGPVGSKVTLTVIRGDEVVHVKITRERLGGAAAALREREEPVE